MRTSAAGTTAEVQRLAGAQSELERWRAEGPPSPVAGTPAGAGGSGEEVAGLARLVEEQRAELVHLAATLAETQKGHAQLALACQVLEGRLAEAVRQLGAGPVDLETVEQLVDRRLAEAAPAADLPDLAQVEKLVAARLEEVQGRLAEELAGQRGHLQAAIERSVTLARVNDDLAGGQAALGERIEALAGQMAQASRRMESLLDRLDVLEAAAYRVDLAGDTAAPSKEARAGSLLESLDRQLEAAARRLAARGQAGAGAGRGEA